MIDLDKIPDDGLRLSGYSEELVLEYGVVLRGVSWHIFIMPSSHDFFIEIKGDASMIGSCDRCLESVNIVVTVDSKFIGTNDHELVVGGNYTLSRQDLDVVFFTGVTLDEEVIIREQFQLQIPMGTICRNDCKGLCHSCGNSLNKGDCFCNLELSNKSSSALARALVNLKLNLNDVDASDNN